MDNVLVDFKSGLDRVPDRVKRIHAGQPDEIPGIFAKMKPMSGAVKAFHTLSEIFDTYIISSAPWKNQTAWSDKLEWIKDNLGESARGRIILTHHKELLRGDFLINHRDKNGANEFQGTLIAFDPKNSVWSEIVSWLKDEA